MSVSNKKRLCQDLSLTQSLLLLSHKDSNLNKQNQNLLCYHYTMRQSS